MVTQCRFVDQGSSRLWFALPRNRPLRNRSPLGQNYILHNGQNATLVQVLLLHYTYRRSSPDDIGSGLNDFPGEVIWGKRVRLNGSARGSLLVVPKL